MPAGAVVGGVDGLEMVGRKDEEVDVVAACTVATMRCQYAVPATTANASVALRTMGFRKGVRALMFIGGDFIFGL